jgi:hypothetical protein
MALKLSIIQDKHSQRYAWQIVDGDRPGWVKRSLLSFGSSGLATAAGIAEMKNLSRIGKDLERARVASGPSPRWVKPGLWRLLGRARS